MKPETADFLTAADHALSKAHRIQAIDILDEAARHAYYAQFHAAQALIFERTGKIARTHKGVSKEFHKLAKAETAFPPGIASQLSKAYRYKETADYETGIVAPITLPLASDAIATAERFIAVVRQALAPPPASAAP